MYNGNPVTMRILRLSVGFDGKTVSMKSVKIKSLLLTAVAAAVSIIVALVGNELLFSQWLVNGVIWGIDYIVLLMASIFVGAFAVIVAAWLPRTAVVFSWVYAVCSGLAMGFFALVFQQNYSSVLFSSFFSVKVTLAVVLLLYGRISFEALTQGRKVLYSALATLAVSQVAALIFMFVFPSETALFAGRYWLQLIISTVLVAVTSFSACHEYEFISHAADIGIPKKYQWTAATSFILTPVFMGFYIASAFSHNHSTV